MQAPNLMACHATLRCECFVVGPVLERAALWSRRVSQFNSSQRGSSTKATCSSPSCRSTKLKHERVCSTREVRSPFWSRLRDCDMQCIIIPCSVSNSSSLESWKLITWPRARATPTEDCFNNYLQK